MVLLRCKVHEKKVVSVVWVFVHYDLYDRTFRCPSKRRNPGSIQLCNEQRPKQQTQLSLRGPYTEEAPSQPLQDELHGVDFGVVSELRIRELVSKEAENDVCNFVTRPV